MRHKYQILFGMKEHPETGELLYPGDVREIEENDIMKPPEFGGWLQLDRDPVTLKAGEKANWVLIAARRVDDKLEEQSIARDEPSEIIGVNVSEKEYLTMERQREGREDAIRTPQRVRQRQAPPNRR